jgi:hypothetical protein
MSADLLSFPDTSVSSMSKFHETIVDVDRFLLQAKPTNKSRFGCQVDGVFLQFCHVPVGDGLRLSIWAELGYLPFSVASHLRRRMLIGILLAAQKLPNVKFGVDKEHQIIVTSEYNVHSIQPPVFIFAPLISFLQEAMPFIKLVGECL